MKMLFYKVTILLVVFMGVSMAVFAQSMTVKGVVIDGDTGETIPGATVVLKGTTNGCATNYDGQFELSNLPKDGILVISMVGYETVEINLSKWKGGTVILRYNGVIITPESKSVVKDAFFISRKRVA